MRPFLASAWRPTPCERATGGQAVARAIQEDLRSEASEEGLNGEDDGELVDVAEADRVAAVDEDVRRWAAVQLLADLWPSRPRRERRRRQASCPPPRRSDGCSAGCPVPPGEGGAARHPAGTLYFFVATTRS
jgi:hypothetical protein